MSRALPKRQAAHSRRSLEPANQDALPSLRAREPVTSGHTNCSRQEVDKMSTRRVKASIDRRGPVPKSPMFPRAHIDRFPRHFVYTTTPFVARREGSTPVLNSLGPPRCLLSTELPSPACGRENGVRAMRRGRWGEGPLLKGLSPRILGSPFLVREGGQGVRFRFLSYPIPSPIRFSSQTGSP